MRNAAVPSFAFQPDTAIFTDTILSVQWLRGLAALIVVLFHLELAPWGASGVDVFFVISGFIMWRTTQHKDMHPATFYRHRIWRIVPIYWIYTLLLALAFFAVPSAFSRLQFDWAHLATSFFFIPWQSPTSGLATPFLVQGWSLNYEMFFYLIFGATLALAPHLRLATITCLLSGLVVLGCLVEPTSTAGRVYLDPLLLEFLAGVWVAQFWRRHAAYLSEPLAGLAIVAAITSLIISTPLASTISGWQRVAVWGTPSVLLLVGALSLESNVARLPALGRLLGDASYSIYLCHTFVISIVAKIWTTAFLSPKGAAFATISVVSCAIVGWLSYIFLERPMAGWVKARNSCAESSR